MIAIKPFRSTAYAILIAIAFSGCSNNILLPNSTKDSTSSNQNNVDSDGNQVPPDKATPISDPTSVTESNDKDVDSENGENSGPAKEYTYAPGQLGLRRLTGWQYKNTIRDLIGIQAASVVTPPADTRIAGYETVGAMRLALASEDQASRYETSAFAAAQTALSRPDKGAWIGCESSDPNNRDCLETFIRKFGKRAFRRPVTDNELSTIADIASGAGQKMGNFDSAIEFAIATILQFPDFIYIVEIGRPLEGSDKLLELTNYELATRLAFFLTGSTPSDELLMAAENGQLSTEAGIREYATQLLKNDNQVRPALRRFFDDYLRLWKLSDVDRDKTHFPNFSESLTNAMLEETRLFLEDLVFDSESSFLDAFDSSYTYINQELADFYGIDFPGDQEFLRAELPTDGSRAGLLGHASFLTVSAHGDETLPTLRGKFVYQMLLCQTIPPPPPGAENKFSLDDNAKTAREKFEPLSKIKDPELNCPVCHTLTDPIGFSLEQYDAIGAFREKENNTTIDPVVSLEGLGEFDGPRSLGTILKNDERVPECFVKQLFRHAGGRIESAGESDEIDRITQAWASNNYKVKALLVELVASKAFRQAANIK